MVFVVDQTFVIVSRCHGIVRARIGKPAPDVHYRLAVHEHRRRRADIVHRQRLGQRVTHRPEPRRTHPVSQPRPEPNATRPAGGNPLTCLVIGRPGSSLLVRTSPSIRA